MKKFNFHNTYEERQQALKTFKSHDEASRAECFNMLWDIIVDQGVGTRKVLEDLGLDDLVENEEFLNQTNKDAILEILERVPSEEVRVYAANFKAEDIALEAKDMDHMAEDMAYDMAHDMDKAHDAERPEKKIIEITAADEDRWEEIVRCFDTFKNKLDAQVREFLNDREQQPEGALTLEDVEDVLYRYTVLAGKHAFDLEPDQMEEELEEEVEVEVEEPEQEEVEAIEEEIPAEQEEDELEKLLAESE
jgi:hypothetical protein